MSDLTVLEQLAEPSGKDVVDIGCGGGALVRALTTRGARVTGVEISEQQLAPALANDGGSGARYLIGRGQELPLQDASVDVAVFMRTLHHVPPGSMLAALREARRVLRHRGVVFVAEPLPEGEFYAITSLVEDELAVRAAAQESLAHASTAGLERETTLEYDVRICLADVAALRDRVVSVDPARADVFDARHSELTDAFKRRGEPGDRPGERCFRQPMRADLLRVFGG
jgi:SAM-dependent methyltransferase